MNILPATDPIRLCIEGPLRELMRPFRSSSLLVNGKIEMLLKSLLARAWEQQASGPTERAFVLDKGCMPPGMGTGGMDVLAVEKTQRGCTAKFWIEAKSSFIEDSSGALARPGGDVGKSARRALKQVDTATHAAAGSPHLPSTAYIVHFLTSLPQFNDEIWQKLPQFVQVKYDRLYRCAARELDGARARGKRNLVSPSHPGWQAWRANKVQQLCELYRAGTDHSSYTVQDFEIDTTPWHGVVVAKKRLDPN
jgi:hypothetical protein